MFHCNQIEIYENERVPLRLIKRSNGLKVACGVLTVCVAATAAYAIPPDQSWVTPLADAQAEAAASGKPLVVLVGMPGCVPCKMMNENTWRNERVKAKLDEAYIRCYMDSGNEESDAWMDKHNVVGFPSVMIFAPDGSKEIKRIESYVAPDEMLEVLTAVAKGVTPPAANKTTGADKTGKNGKTVVKPSDKMDKPSGSRSDAVAKKKADEAFEAALKSATNGKEKSAGGKKQPSYYDLASDSAPTDRGHSPVTNKSAGEYGLYDDQASDAGDDLPKSPDEVIDRSAREIAGRSNESGSRNPQGNPMFIPPPQGVEKQRSSGQKTFGQKTVNGLRRVGNGMKSVGSKILRFGRGNGGGADGDPDAIMGIINMVGEAVADENKDKKEELVIERSEKSTTGSDALLTPTPTPTPAPTPEETPVDVVALKERYKAALKCSKESYSKNALAMCESIVREDPLNKSGVADMAYIMMAALTVTRNDEVLRLRAYNMLCEFMARYPNSPNVDYYTVVRASLAHGMGKKDEAYRLLYDFPKRFPNSKRMGMARREWSKLTGESGTTDMVSPLPGGKAAKATDDDEGKKKTASKSNAADKPARKTAAKKSGTAAENKKSSAKESFSMYDIMSNKSLSNRSSGAPASRALSGVSNND